MSVLGIEIIIHYHIKSSIFFSFSIASYGHIALDLKHFSEPNRCLQYCFTTYKESFQFLNSAALHQTKDPIPYVFLNNGAMIHKWSMHGHYIYNQHIITFLRSGYFLNSECALILNLLYSQFIHHIKITDNVLFIMLPYIQQLNFQLQNMIECPFQYYSVYHIIKSPNKSYGCNFWYNFSHILKSRNRFFHHHFLT